MKADCLRSGDKAVRLHTAKAVCSEAAMEPRMQGRAHGISLCRERLSVPGCVHALPFQAFLESEKAAYLIRPHVFADLYHRLSTRPFLSRIEKV